MGTPQRRTGPARLAVLAGAGVAGVGFLWAVVSGPQPLAAGAAPAATPTVQSALNRDLPRNRQSPLTADRRASPGEGLRVPWEDGEWEDEHEEWDEGGRLADPRLLPPPPTGQQAPLTQTPRFRTRGS